MLPARQGHRRPLSARILVLLALVLALLTLVTASSSSSDFDDDDDDDDLSSSGWAPLPSDPVSSRSLLWGTYRPQIYFGPRPKLPQTLLTGLLWFDAKDYAGVNSARHECSDGDRMRGYGYTHHDGRTYASQDIEDIASNYRITTQWIRLDDAGNDAKEGSNEASWAARISGAVLDDTKPAVLSPLFYIALESEEGTLETSFEEDDFAEGVPPAAGPIDFLTGSQAELGPFKLRLGELPGANQVPAGSSEKVHNWHYAGLSVPPSATWAGKTVLLSEFSRIPPAWKAENPDAAAPPPWELLHLPDEVRSNPTFFAVQRTFTGNFSFDVFYDGVRGASAAQKLDSSQLTHALSAARTAFEDRFEDKFGLAAKGYPDEHVRYAREITASLIGGVGYYHGGGIVDRSFKHGWDAGVGDGALDMDEEHVPDPRMTEDMELFTATPSRSMFPRGFYWDEGFHLLHLGIFDNDLSLEIFKSWISLIDEDGWVAREQILGDEARSRVPQQFQTQYPSYANPPTLLIALENYIERLRAQQSDAVGAGGAAVDPSYDPTSQNVFADATSGSGGVASRMIDDSRLARSFLRSVYPRLRRHYAWFRRTQRGEIKEWDRTVSARGEAYRWRGRTKDHVLTSGLDDYPRAKVPHSGELHLDLHAWMGFFAKTMANVAAAVGEEDDVREFERHYEGIVKNLEDLHWSEEKQMYCDASVNENDESYLECHAGYVSLFPLLLGLLPSDSPRLGAVLDMLSDPEQLWTPYGLRSLSAREPLFGQGENYWRGPIWLPINFLALRQLQVYASQPGPNQARAGDIASKLKKNLIDNTFKVYKETGFTWEQFSPHDGKGQRSHPFTGWSSLVALMMKM